MEMRWDIILLVVQSGVLGPLEVGLIDITVAVTDGRSEGVVGVIGKFDQRDSLGSDLL
jgi:hypothetical protein